MVRMESSKVSPMKIENEQSNSEFFIFKKPKKPLKGKSKSESISADKACLQTNEGLPSRTTVSDTSEGRTLFIRNVPFDSDEDTLQQYLSTFGQLEFVKIVRDKLTQHSRGSAFAKFVSKDDVDNILFRYSKPFVRAYIGHLPAFLTFICLQSFFFCFQSSADFTFGGRKLDLVLAVSKEEVAKLQTSHQVEWAPAMAEVGGRNLHLARFGCMFSLLIGHITLFINRSFLIVIISSN